MNLTLLVLLLLVVLVGILLHLLLLLLIAQFLLLITFTRLTQPLGRLLYLTVRALSPTLTPHFARWVVSSVPRFLPLTVSESRQLGITIFVTPLLGLVTIETIPVGSSVPLTRSVGPLL